MLVVPVEAEVRGQPGHGAGDGTDK